MLVHVPHARQIIPYNSIQTCPDQQIEMVHYLIAYDMIVVYTAIKLYQTDHSNSNFKTFYFLYFCQHIKEEARKYTIL